MDFKVILALLATKFTGVRKDGLEQLARSLALQVANEEEAKSVIEKLSADKVSEFVKEFRSQIDKENSKATETLEKNLRDKFDFVEKKPKTQEPNNKETNPNDISAVVANAVANAIKPLQQRLESYERGETSKSRLQALNDKLASCKDETFKAQTLKDFNRMQFETDEAFNEYLTEKEADIVTVNQNLADATLSGQGSPMFSKKNTDGISKSVSEFVESQKSGNNTLSGKDV
ncbi:hypothetical protein ACILDU_03875 [Capnocytophaga canimorsus]|uniref:hypothetical protein n=1 Tax=Capnocytophaga canimorsus TaxID=28188 RepID=UPI0037D0CDFF